MNENFNLKDVREFRFKRRDIKNASRKPSYDNLGGTTTAQKYMVLQFLVKYIPAGRKSEAFIVNDIV